MIVKVTQKKAVMIKAGIPGPPGPGGPPGQIGLTPVIPAQYARDVAWAIKGRSVAADRRVLLTPTDLLITINGQSYRTAAQGELDLLLPENWDSAATDYTVAANRAGQDYYVYACQPAAGTEPLFLLSANSTVPAGYTAGNSRKVGGFHCLCVAVGVIVGHPLTGFAAGDVLPETVWDLSFRPVCSPEGMSYDAKSGIWTDIYLTSGAGATTASANGATISDSRTWLDFVDDLGAVSKRLLTDPEFQLVAAGGNERTNIAGSVDPVTTGGHVDTAGRRMISNIGLEDCCGVVWQWLSEQSYRNDDAAYSGVWSWTALPGNKGSLYKQGGTGDAKLAAGGSWTAGTACGSRSRFAANYRWLALSQLGARGCTRSL